MKREPSTLGEHLLKRRVTQGLLQEDVAKVMGVNPWTYLLWEQGRSNPEMRYWPKIISFLGSDPSPPPVSLAGKIKSYRRRHGLSQAKLASLLEVHETSICEWENGFSKPMIRSLCKLLKITG